MCCLTDVLLLVRSFRLFLAVRRIRGLYKGGSRSPRASKPRRRLAEAAEEPEAETFVTSTVKSLLFFVLGAVLSLSFYFLLVYLLDIAPLVSGGVSGISGGVFSLLMGEPPLLASREIEVSQPPLWRVEAVAFLQRRVESKTSRSQLVRGYRKSKTPLPPPPSQAFEQ